jgi:hypothetical protein
LDLRCQLNRQPERGVQVAGLSHCCCFLFAVNSVTLTNVYLTLFATFLLPHDPLQFGGDHEGKINAAFLYSIRFVGVAVFGDYGKRNASY